MLQIHCVHKNALYGSLYQIVFGKDEHKVLSVFYTFKVFCVREQNMQKYFLDTRSLEFQEFGCWMSISH